MIEITAIFVSGFVIASLTVTPYDSMIRFGTYCMISWIIKKYIDPDDQDGDGA